MSPVNDSATDQPIPEVGAISRDGVPLEIERPSQGTPHRGVAYLYMLAAFVVVTAGLRMAQEILQLLLLSIFIAVVGVPVYEWLVQKKLASWLALLIVISGLLMTTLVVFWIVMTSVADFSARQDDYAEKLRIRTQPFRALIEQLIPEEPNKPEDEIQKLDVDSPAAPAGTAGLDVLRGSPDVTASADEPAEGGLAAVDPFPDSANARPNGDSPDPEQHPTADERQAEETVNEALNSAARSPQEDDSELDGSTRDDANHDDLNGDTELVESMLDGDSRPVMALLDGEPEAGDEHDDKYDDEDHLDIFDHDYADGDGWLRPRRVLEPPMSRRTWRELIMSQFDPTQMFWMGASLARSISQILSNTMLILLTVVFILLEASTFPRKLVKAFGDKGETIQRYRQIVVSIRSYLVIKTALSILTGTLLGGWLWIFGVPYAGLWGMIAFLFNYIPNIGSILAAIPALMVAWLDLGLMPCLGCGLGYLAVNLGIGNFLEPRIMGRGMGLSPLVVFCSMVFWGWALGPVGMLLSVPLTMTMRVALDGFEDTRWLATLLDNPE